MHPSLVRLNLFWSIKMPTCGDVLLWQQSTCMITNVLVDALVTSVCGTQQKIPSPSGFFPNVWNVVPIIPRKARGTKGTCGEDGRPPRTTDKARHQLEEEPSALLPRGPLPFLELPSALKKGSPTSPSPDPFRASIWVGRSRDCPQSSPHPWIRMGQAAIRGCLCLTEKCGDKLS